MAFVGGGRQIGIRVFEDDREGSSRCRTAIASSWRETHAASDVLIACTVSDRRYVDLPPKEGALPLDEV